MTAILNITRIYVDADACPVKDEIYRVAVRHAVPSAWWQANSFAFPRIR
jgi:uncharacterized protein